MSRRARIVFSGHVYHVTQRGNNRQFVFESNQDYIFYLKTLEKHRQKNNVDIFAFCLMGNHVHFILRPNDKQGLAKMFQLVHMSYAQYFQKKNGTSGHVWQGRFYSCLLHDDHLREAVKYVELNPVRAGIVDKAWRYSWSSAGAHMGKQYKRINLADINEIMDIKNWKVYLSERSREEFLQKLRSATGKNLVLGPEPFVEFLEQKLGRKIKLKMGRPKVKVGTDPTF